MGEGPVNGTRTGRSRRRWHRSYAAALAAGSAASPASATAYRVAARSTTTPIKHLVVIFQENVSFDHYFGTYPKAANTDGTTFTAKPGTPKVNGLSKTLLT